VLGFVPDIRPIVQRGSVFIAPIRTGSGTKIKVLNAMAQAKPVVATTVAAEGIDVTPGENILIADDPEEFAKKVLYLLRNEEIAKKIGERARKLMEKKYNWDLIAENIHKIYEDCKR
jgi:glycosyltransferase involved in cell wall biosynthesis